MSSESSDSGLPSHITENKGLKQTVGAAHGNCFILRKSVSLSIDLLGKSSVE